MEYAAIRHFADKRYCYAMGKGRFLIRLETKRNDAENVILHVRDKYLPLKMIDTRREYVMEKAGSDDLRDYYETVIEIDVVCLRYFFEIEDIYGNITYYGNHEFFDECITDIERMFDCSNCLNGRRIKWFIRSFRPVLPRIKKCRRKSGIRRRSIIKRT